MRVERVTTNETCNQNCWFCNARRPAERPEFVARLAVQRRIAAAHAVGAKEVVLTGGEPTLRSDIVDLIERAAQGGARAVLETDGALIGGRRSQRLAAAGRAIARVQLVAWGNEADQITREPGGFAAALRGIRALAAAGVTVEITIPVVRRNVGRLAVLTREIAAAQLPVRALLLVIVTTAPDSAECLSLREAADEVGAVAEAARGVGLTVQLAPQSFLSPCVFEKPERVTHLFALNRGHAARPGFLRVAACAECLVSDRCPGLPADASGPTPVVRPIRDDRVRRRLTVASSVEEQIAREFIGLDQLRSAENELVSEYTVR